MTTLSIKFALEGFRLIRARPKLILFWGALNLIGSALMMMIVVMVSGPAIQGAISVLQTISDSGATDPNAPSLKLAETALAQHLQDAAPGMIYIMPINMILQAVLTCAVCRAVFTARDDAWGFLRFGLRELQILAVEIVMLALGGAALFAVLMVAGTIGAVMGAAGMALAGMLGIFGGGGLLIWVQIRLSLNRAQSFDTGRVDVFGSFLLTRDLFWSLFSGYAAALALAAIVYFLGGQIISVILEVAFGGPSLKLPVADMSSLHSFLTPATIVERVLVDGLLSPLISAILIGAPVAAYQMLSGKAPMTATPEAF